MNFAIPLQPAKGRPAFISRARERHEELLEHKPLRLLELHGAELLPRWQQRRMVPRRPEFREAAGRVIGAMLEHLDTASGRVGAPRGDGYVTPPAQQGPEGREDEFGIAVEAGCSIQQVRRVIGAYVRAGYLHGPRKGPDGHMLPGPSGRRYQRVEKYWSEETGEWQYCAHRVVYVFTPLFFERLRLGKDWRAEQAAAAARRKARRERLYPGALLEGRDRVRGMRHGSRETRAHGVPGAPTYAISPSPSPAPRAGGVDAETNAARLVQLILRGLRNKHPDWPPERLRAEAEALERRGRLS
jgi:hypothetical protein